MLSRVHPMMWVFSICLLTMVTMFLLGRPSEKEETVTNDVLYLQSQGDFWFKDDTAFFVKKGSISPVELELLQTLAYEKEVVVFSDLR